MKAESQYHVAALASQSGNLSQAFSRLEKMPDDPIAKLEAEKHCGAAILVLVSLIDNFELNLIGAIEAGEQELK